MNSKLISITLIGILLFSTGVFASYSATPSTRGNPTFKANVSVNLIHMPQIDINGTWQINLPKENTTPALNCPQNVFRPEFSQHYIIKQLRLTNFTNSMYPALDVQNESRVDYAYAYPFEKLQICDIVIFERFKNDFGFYDRNCMSEGNCVVHRIIAKTADGFLTKGDANEDDDLISFDITLQPENYVSIVVGAS